MFQFIWIGRMAFNEAYKKDTTRLEILTLDACVQNIVQFTFVKQSVMRLGTLY